MGQRSRWMALSILWQAGVVRAPLRVGFSLTTTSPSEGCVDEDCFEKGRRINKLTVAEGAGVTPKDESLVLSVLARDSRASFTGRRVGFGTSVSAYRRRSWRVLELAEFFGGHSSTVHLCISIPVLYLFEPVARTPHLQ